MWRVSSILAFALAVHTATPESRSSWEERPEQLRNEARRTNEIASEEWSEARERTMRSGYEYTYAYDGRLLTGFPELNSRHLAGLHIKARAIVTILDRDRWVIRLRDVEHVDMNGELQSLSGEPWRVNWRHLRSPKQLRRSSDRMQRQLDLPIEIIINERGVEKIRISSEDDEYSVNIKKAVAAQLLDNRAAYEEIAAQLLRSDETQNPEERNPEREPRRKQEERAEREEQRRGEEAEERREGESERRAEKKRRREEMIQNPEEGGRWLNLSSGRKVYVDSVDGICGTTYHAYRVPESVASERYAKMKHDACTRRRRRDPSDRPSRLIEVVKTRDTKNCIHSAEYRRSGPGIASNKARSSPLESRTSVTRYQLCETDDGVVIDRADSEEEMSANPLRLTSEKALAGSRLRLRLAEIRKISRSASEPDLGPNAIEDSSLGIKYYRSYDEEVDGAAEMAYKTGNNESQRRAYEARQSEREAIYNRCLGEIEVLVAEIVERDLSGHENIARREIPLKALSVAKALRKLPEAYVNRAVGSLDKKFGQSDVYRNIMPDLIAMCASKACIRRALRTYNDERFPSAEHMTFWIMLPSRVYSPTEDLLDDLFAAAHCTSHGQNKVIRDQAMVSLAHLVHKACISENSDQYYPVRQRGRQYCSSDSRIVRDKLLPTIVTIAMLDERPEVAGRQGSANLAILALGLLGSDDSLPIIKRIIEAEDYDSDNMDITRRRVLAVRALTRIGHRRRDEIGRVLSSIIANRAEAYEVRIAALDVLIKIGPSPTALQQVAMQSWTEKDEEFLKAINTGLRSVADLSPRQDSAPHLIKAARVASLLAPLMKRTSTHMPSSMVYFVKKSLPALDIDVVSSLSYASARNNLGPQQVDIGITNWVNDYEYKPMELGVYLGDSIRWLNDMPRLDLMPMRDLIPDWKAVSEQLKIRPRHAEVRPLRGPLLYARIFDDIIIATALDDSHNQMPLVESAVTRLRLKIFDFAPQSSSYASAIGLPIDVDFDSMALLSYAHLPGDRGSRTSSIGLRVDGQIQLYAHIATIDPFTDERVIAGYDSHVSTSLPLRIGIGLNELFAEVELSNEMETVDLLHMHAVPFTARSPRSKLNPYNGRQHCRIIKSKTARETKEVQLAPGYKLKVEAENRMSLLQDAWSKFDNFAYDPVSMAQLLPAIISVGPRGRISLRYQEIALRYEPRTARANKIRLTPNARVITKMNKNDEWRVVNRILNWIRNVPTIRPSPMSRDDSNLQPLESVKSALGRPDRATAVSIGAKLRVSGRSSDAEYEGRIAVGVGQKNLRRRFAVRVDSPNQRHAVCMAGEIDAPVSPAVWDPDMIRAEMNKITLKAELAYGPECRGSAVKLEADAQTSAEQKERASRSKASQQYRLLRHKRLPLADMSPAADRARSMASLLDDWKVVVKTENSNAGTSAVKAALEGAEIYLLPYLEVSHPDERSPSIRQWAERAIKLLVAPISIRAESSLEISARIRIDREKEKADVAFDLPGSEAAIRFRKIALSPYFIYIWTAGRMAGRDILDQAYQLGTGQRHWRACASDGLHVNSFDNVTVRHDDDRCEYLLAADCEVKSSFAVLSRRVDEARREVSILLPGVKIQMHPAKAGRGSPIPASANGQSLNPQKYRLESITNERGQCIATIERADDEVLILDSPFLRAKYDGHDLIEIEVPPSLRGRTCGLCGDNNLMRTADWRDPRACVLESPAALSSAYRLGHEAECRRRPEAELAEERCVRDKISPSPLLAASERRNAESRANEWRKRVKNAPEPARQARPRTAAEERRECIEYRHDVILRSGRTCISKQLISSCRPGCENSGLKRSKEIEYTCLDEYADSQPRSRSVGEIPNRSSAEQVARQNRRLAEEAVAGQQLPELRSAATHFRIEHTIPTACSRA